LIKGEEINMTLIRFLLKILLKIVGAICLMWIPMIIATWTFPFWGLALTLYFAFMSMIDLTLVFGTSTIIVTMLIRMVMIQRGYETVFDLYRDMVRDIIMEAKELIWRMDC